MKRKPNPIDLKNLSARICASVLVCSASFVNAGAAEPEPADQWMTGFPPADHRIIRNSDRDFFAGEKLRWTVCHLRELFPTKKVHRGLGASAGFEYALDSAIDGVKFTPIGSQEAMTWGQALDVNHTDGLIVLHEGKVVYERYAGCLDEMSVHAAMSMTKSLTGLLAETLIVEGELDEFALAKDVIPELRGSAFGDATVRQIMNMTTGVQFSEDYSNPEADIWKYSAAASPMPRPGVYKGPRSYFEYLQTVQPNGDHGEAFTYRTINTDALGWIIARVSGKSVAELLSERIWQRMGAEQSGYFTIDSIGTPFAGGGLNAGLRDLARIGQMMLNEGRFNGQQVVPAEAVRRIRQGGDPELFAKAGYTTLPNGSYKSMWWVFHNENKAYAARGVHGQTIYVDPTAEMVIVRFASHPQAANSEIDPTSLPAYQALANYLSREKK